MAKAKLLTVILAAALVSLPALAARNYYKWTDEEGVTHYSARKPHDRQADVVSVATGRTVQNNETANSQNRPSQGASQPAEAESSAANTQEQVLKDPERCAAARNNLKVLSTNARVRMEGPDGEIHYLSEEEKAEKTREYEQAVEESC